MASTQKAVGARTVVVTGAGRGLGLAAAHRIGRDGYRVVVAELDAGRGESAAKELREAGVDADFRRLDVADEASVRELARSLEGERLHGLVNNAGLADAVGGKYFHEIDVADWDRIMAVNARGPWLVAKELLPLMLRGEAGGRIVNLASDAALYGSPRLAHYIASKGAVISLTRAMAREVGDHGITVNAVAPGLTEGESSVNIPLERHELYRLNRAIGRPQQPADLVGLIAFLVGEESGYITGQTFAVNGGFTMN
ncbi:SDR family oxidoreductase [Phaeacidiphilus oryzae]|uniref:SDR family oxidoreductase n=1 Tax=Phaeacidiphilus oryzae TaxID=348818 RepID=UPI000565713B|nr:SDR family oxidoreductase [Phaeacidiphilus oryzae]